MKKYFEYIRQEEEDNNEQGEKMLSQLTGNLKSKVHKEIYGKILRSQKVFSLNFSEEFISDLAMVTRERIIGPEEILFSCGEAVEYLYIILKGRVLH